jgi:hypothetical protein
MMMMMMRMMMMIAAQGVKLDRTLPYLGYDAKTPPPGSTKGRRTSVVAVVVAASFATTNTTTTTPPQDAQIRGILHIIDDRFSAIEKVQFPTCIQTKSEYSPADLRAVVGYSAVRRFEWIGLYIERGDTRM